MSIIAANNPKSSINLLNLFSFPKQVSLLFPDGKSQNLLST
jgi:hypothetical protein